MELFKYNFINKEALLFIKVNPNSTSNKIYGFMNINNQLHLKLSISTPPIKNCANNEIIIFLSQELNIPRENLLLVKGSRNNFKTILIKNIEQGYLNSVLNTYITTDN